MQKSFHIKFIFLVVVATVIFINFIFNIPVIYASSSEDEKELNKPEDWLNMPASEVAAKVKEMRRQQEERRRKLSTEKSYFLACKGINVTDKQYASNGKGGFDENVINFKKGTLFDASAAYCAYRTKSNVEMKIKQRGWENFDEPNNLKVYYGINGTGFKGFGWVDLASGFWFKSENDISKIISRGYNKGYDGDELFKKPLDEKFIDIMCSPHSTQFSVDGNMFTDITMKKSEEYLNFVEKKRLEQEAMNERIRQKKEAEEKRIQAERQEEDRIIQDRKEKLQTELKKYGAEALVKINMLEVNPYEFEGHTIAVEVQFRKMQSKNSASFYSGYSNLEKYTNVYDEIIVTGIPSGTHFESGPFSPRMMLALKGKGTIAGTNAFGARIEAPHFQWIAIMSGKQQSVFEEQRDVSRKNALQNMKNAYPKRDQ
jgi:hypothetical protein